MADSNLYKMGRVMNLEPFVTRVRAAVLEYASKMALGGAASEAKNFGIYVLKNPNFEEVSMTALVAADPAVLAQVTLIDGLVPSVESVTDDAIRTVVAAKWSLVATKYPVVTATAPA
jgi:hypothetical protein